MLLPLVVYLMIANKVRDYKIMVPLSYLMIHGIMWCTIWAIYYLPDRLHANEGFIIMHLMFVAVGFCAPIKWSVVSHALLIVDILVSYPINEYENIDLMMTLGIPALIAVEVMLYIMEKAYIDQYNIKKELQNLSFYDQLTNAYNRNKLKELCMDDTNILKLTNVVMIIMDIDFFKKVNDTYGHSAGDQVLKQLVTLLKINIREKTDYIIRWGGEEFVIILSDCNLIKATDIAERIRQTVENYTSACCKFTISLGVAKYLGGDYNEAIKNADKALYYSKEHGRNKVSVYDNGKIA
jgi:diguanylate cyclase (GGDEF)-like protein